MSDREVHHTGVCGISLRVTGAAVEMGKGAWRLKNTLQEMSLATEINSRSLNSIDEQLALLGMRLTEGQEGLRREVNELRSTVEVLKSEVGAMNELLRLMAANQLMLLADDGGVGDQKGQQ